jgi:nucleotide-binding universal stress UspA family protein
VKRTVRKALQAIVPKSWQPQDTSPRWSQQKVAEGHSEALFTDILVLLQDNPAWQQALVIGQRETSRLVGLQLNEANEAVQQAFVRHCQEAGLPHVQVMLRGNVVDTVCQHATLADLLVLSFSAFAPGLLSCGSQPVLLVPDEVSPLSKVLLTYESQQQDALFVAAYLAEAWGLALTIVLQEKAVPAALQSYMEHHEIEADYVTATPITAQALSQAAKDHQCDLLVTSTTLWPQLNLANWHLPILVCH